MCALIVIRSELEEFPLLVAANRDEFYERPAIPPREDRAGSLRFVAPRDERAGGSWLGVNEKGLFAALTNRPAQRVDPKAPSRGLLVPEILGCDDLASARRAIARRLEERRFNPFNLLLSSREESWVGYHRGEGGRVDWVPIPRGVHLLTNEHDLDELVVEEIENLLLDSPPTEELFPRLRFILSDHTEREGHALCKHFEKRGTRSSALLALPGTGFARARFDFADGAPCSTPYVDRSDLLRNLDPALEIEVRFGDITTVDLEGVVNAANSLGEMGGGIAGALRRRGGIEIEKEAMAKAPIPIGKAVATNAGQLAFRKIIHAPTMERPAMRTSVEKVRLAMRAALRSADEEGLRSLAIPGLGTGVGSLSPTEAARAMVEELRAFRGERLRRVLLIDIDRGMVAAFEELLKS